MRALILFIAKEWVLALCLTLIILLFYSLGWQPFKSFEINSYDFRSDLRRKLPASPIVIVDIDYESIEKLGAWPWPRTRIADLISLLNSYEATVIGLDLLYAEASSDLIHKEIALLIDDFKKKGSKKKKALSPFIARLKEVGEKLDEDKALATAVKSARNVVMPMHFSLQRLKGARESDLVKMLKRLHDGGMEASHVYGNEVRGPIGKIAKKSRAIGHNNRIADEDGKIRREYLLIDYKGSFYPSFSLQVAALYLNSPVKPVKNLDSIRTRHGLKIDTLEIPTGDDNSMLISFNEPKSFSRYSFHEVMEEKIPAEKFKDRIVLVGLNGRERLMHSEVLGMAGQDSLLITANVIENIINGNHLMRPPWAFPIEAGVIIAIGFFLAFFAHRLSRRAAIASIFAFSIIWSILTIYLFIEHGLWLSMVYPTFLLIFGYISMGVIKRLIRNKDMMDQETIESNKMLALSFQSQGLLDMAFDKLKRCPVRGNAIREHLYNLALDFERKRMLNKAIVVYEHLLRGGKFKDVKDRIKKLKDVEQRLVLGHKRKGGDETVLIEGAQTNPTLGRYEIIEELGRGAMGIVYLGKDPKINREVAIKTLSYEDVEESQISETKSRFIREAEAMGNLSHPNIVTIYDVGEDMGVAYMAMELLDGKELDDYCKKDNLMPMKDTLRVIASVADALGYAHGKGVVHRDVKPSNIMVLPNREIKVADFGIARVMDTSKTSTGIILGTPSYMSPEQISGKQVDGRSDLFSLGVVFYELVTGERPFKGDSFAALMNNIVSTAHAPAKNLVSHIPGPVEAIMDRLLEKRLTKRYKSGMQVSKDILDVMMNMKD